jgi:hypothetical protein
MSDQMQNRDAGVDPVDQDPMTEEDTNSGGAPEEPDHSFDATGDDDGTPPENPSGG